MRPLKLTCALLLLGLLITSSGALACDGQAKPKAQPTQPEATQDVPALTAPKSAPVPQDIKYEGDGALKVAKAELMFETPELRLERQPWKLEDLEGVAFRVRLSKQGAEAKVLAVNALESLSDIVGHPAAPSWAAINGGFYEDDTKGGYRPMGVVRANKHKVKAYTYRGGSGLFLVDAQGPKIIHRSAWEKHRTQAVEALQSIDRVVDEGKSLVNPKADARYAARSAVALDKEHIWLVASVANASLYTTSKGYRLRKTSYLGMPLWAFAQYLAQHVGAQQALNLDGAVSTQLIVQTPSQRFELLGERGTMNAILLGQ